MLGSQIACSKKMIDYSIYKNIPDTSPYQMKHVQGNVGCFVERGGTIGWMTSGKNSVLVDTQFPETILNFSNEFKKITDESIDIVFNTHHHGDHTGGNISLKDRSKKFIAHTNSLKNQKKAAVAKGNLDKVHLPNITFDNTYKTKVGKENIMCYYYGEAHTDGDIIVHFQESNVVHIGDLVFNRRFPYIDKGANASIKNWIIVLDHINNQFDNNTKIICGHAGKDYDVIINKEDIKAFQNYLSKLLIFGEKSIKEGKEISQLIAETKVIPGAEEWKGDGIQRSLEAVYVELGKQI